MENQVSLMNEVTIDGCLVLGQSGPPYSTYNTRYYVDRKSRRAHFNANFLLDPCVPCCTTKNQSSPGKAVSSVLSSESFLLFLHVLVLTIGVSKECFRLRDLDRSLYFYQSLVESTLTTVQLIVRLSSIWFTFRGVKLAELRIEHVEEETSVRGRSLQRIVIFYMATVSLFTFGNLVFFAIINHHSHLGWTILANNLCLIIALLMTQIMHLRISEIEHQIEQDTHKLLLCETLLLLRESFMLQNTEDRQDYLLRVERFLTAYKNTAYFSIPSHIHVLQQHIPDWNLYSSSEHITVV